jgi:hypothetical protein
MGPLWFYQRGESRLGPLATDALITALLGEPEPQMVKVWREGFADWQRAGTQLELRDRLPPRLTADTKGPTSTPSLSVSGPVGIGGWLLLLCIILTIIQPIIQALVGTGLLVSDLPGVAPLGIANVVLAGGSLYAGLSLWRKMPNAVRVATVFLFANLVLTGIESVALARITADGDAARTIATDIGRTAISTLIWARYLMTSKRVRNTFPQKPSNQIEMAV